MNHKCNKSHLQNRVQKVQINKMVYSNTEVNFEIPRGSVLGPIIFNLYVNSNTKTFTNMHVTMYADDVSIFLKNKSLEDLEIDRF